MTKSIGDLIIEYFKNHPKQDLEHGPVVDWVTQEYLKYNKTPPRDPWRAIRKLHQKGILIKLGRGVYRYDSDKIKEVKLLDFSPDIKKAIFKRDNYRCVVCNKGRDEGVEICVDHIKPKDKGGTNTINNGQTLCTQHNLLKKNYTQTEAGKRYFSKMYEAAIAKEDRKIIKFCRDVFDVYNTHKINSHIRRPDKYKKR